MDVVTLLISQDQPRTHTSCIHVYTGLHAARIYN
jgi:hypothetical protein